MGQQKRNDIEIKVKLLESCKEGIKRTRLMYLSNLSYRTFCKYVDFLIDSGFITYEEKEYRITKKGQQYLRSAKEYLELKEKLKKLREEVS
ncbi:hypothetical protein GWK48_07420 [Metallosphaera tengchongensis]|uniref:ArnR1-like winged helix-turn-helix domain-containing protein n=2 Tax=Metallosphaera tengchongensis TaxID=1532350 RepID=A0A6N0NVX8_9CREN|nr:hypothetical protein GWK48_07420 [Metallosphaera tengchongensis]